MLTYAIELRIKLNKTFSLEKKDNLQYIREKHHFIENNQEEINT